MQGAHDVRLESRNRIRPGYRGQALRSQMENVRRFIRVENLLHPLSVTQITLNKLYAWQFRKRIGAVREIPSNHIPAFRLKKSNQMGCNKSFLSSHQCDPFHSPSRTCISQYKDITKPFTLLSAVKDGMTHKVT